MSTNVAPRSGAPRNPAVAVDRSRDDRRAEQADRLIEQLRNGLVKMSHAASGLDDDLDSRLGALRKKIRQATSGAEIEELITSVSRAVVAMDAKTKVREKDQVLAGQRLLGAIDLLKPSWQLRRKKKLIGSALTGKKSDFVKFLKDYSDVLIAAVREQGQGGERSLIGKMLSKSAAAPESIDEGTLEAIEAIRSSLLRLINQLDGEGDLRKFAGALRERLAQKLEPDNLPDIIESIADLAETARQLEQRRFEDFVAKLGDQFSELERVVTTSLEAETEATTQRAETATQLDKATSQIREHIARATNLRSLQQAVGDEVARMADTLSRQNEIEAIRHKKFEASIGLLQEKLGEAHSECNSLYSEIQHLRVKSQLDPLTGLPNRAGFMDRAQQEFERALRYGNKLTVAVADIDHFKKVNDRYGHQAGDTVIVEVGSIIANNLRKSDFVCRYGGEEFVMLLTETNLEKAMQVAEKIRLAISNCPFAFRDRRVQVTCSIGVAELQANQSISELVERADVALYEAKNAGRNRAMTQRAH